MRVFNNGTIRRWQTAYPEAASAIQRWYDIVLAADWENSAHMKTSTGFSADVIDSEATVFDFFNNRFRLICRIDYTRHTVFLVEFLPHADYDRVDVAKLTYSPDRAKS